MLNDVSFRQNTVGTEYTMQQQVHTDTETSQQPQLPSGEQAQHVAANCSAHEQDGSYKISEGLKQLGIELPSNILTKVLENNRDKSPMEIFLGEAFEEPANYATDGDDGAAWSDAATAGSGEENPSWKQ